MRPLLLACLLVALAAQATAEARAAAGAAERPRRVGFRVAQGGELVEPSESPRAVPHRPIVVDKPLEAIRLNVVPDVTRLPEDRSTELFTSAKPFGREATRGWIARGFHWAAPNFAHQPTYFDNIPAERYGQTLCPVLQPVFNGAHFFASLPAVPYKMAVNPPHELIYTMGYYRPGSPAPCVRQQVPWQADAATVETAVVLGLIFALP